MIAPMQGFCVQATDKNAKLKFDYNKLVWNADYSKGGNAPLHAPSRKPSNATTTDVKTLRVSIYANDFSDHLYFLESDKYDASYENGYDARKKNEGLFNIFAVEEDEKLAVDATNSIIGTHIGVRTGGATMYTFNFSHLNADNLALFDVEADETVAIEEGAEYIFFAEPNTVITERFQIIAGENSHGITTGSENTENRTKVHKFIQNGQLYILKNGVLYNATGAVVR